MNKQVNKLEGAAPKEKESDVPGVMVSGLWSGRKEAWDVWVLKERNKKNSQGDEPFVSTHHKRKFEQVERITRGRQLGTR